MFSHLCVGVRRTISKRDFVLVILKGVLKGKTIIFL